jgi:ATP-dependent DNA helicase DinG
VPGLADDVDATRRAVVARLPGGGEIRPGQAAMARAVADAITSRRHLVVQAGTGTGKSLAYLVPALLSGQRVVVATATKALQDQLAGRDLPFLAEHLGPLPHHGRPLRWAVLKGRSNYLCLQRVTEATTRSEGRLELDDAAPAVRREILKLATWSALTETGDQADLDWSPSARAWATVSVSAMECPGAARCPAGDTCFAERARRAADGADVVVVNTHLYGLDLATDGVLLPPHDVVVVDEAHQLEDVVAATNGVTLGPGRLPNLARLVGAVVASDELGRALTKAGDTLADALGDHRDQRLPEPPPVEIAAALAVARNQVDDALRALRAIETRNDDVTQRRLRAQRAAGHLAGDVELALAPGPDRVSWVDGPPSAPQLQVAAIDVAPVLTERLWSRRTAVLTSATIPPGLAERLGLPPDTTDTLDVGSPFDYPNQGLLYCAVHLPDPRSPQHPAAVHDELEALITAAGGRTLALFTSWRAMTAAADALRPRLPFEILTQADLPKPALVEAFRAVESRCLFATAGLFQGIDVPGDTLSLVTIDRIPFPRPDDPLLQARRERARERAFAEIDLPRAATLLAQATGRLIRSATDRGVVAVLDPRLNTAGYRWDLVRALPPLRRTRHRAEAEAFLRSIVTAGEH